jgi:putative aldouronate transport system permease protein
MINAVIKSLGMTQIDFINKPQFFQSIYVWSGVWQNTGWNSVIFFAALANVDPQLHESAVIDGATKLKRIWYINLPVIMPTAIILLILNMGSIMSVGFEKVYLLQTLLNMDKSDVIATYVYRLGIQGGRYSFSTAVGLFNSGINCILLIIFNSISKRVSEISLW